MRETLDRDTPAGRRHIIERPRLTRLLDETSARVIMLVAPAGYGKTTLARQWLSSRPHAWSQATPAWSDVAALAVAIAEALARLEPGVERQLKQRLRSTTDVAEDISVLAELQAEALVGWKDDAWLVIDDYHLFQGSEAAERYVDLLVASTRLRVLLTSRSRPVWATARRLLYGEVYELGRAPLAMNEAEASNVLAEAANVRLPGLVAVAEGWPAVIGLAALTNVEAIDDVLPQTLYEYLADELFHGASPRLQHALPQLALARRLPIPMLDAIFGHDEASLLVAEASRLGFFAKESAELELHPLLRAFLLRKLADEDQHQALTTVRQMASFLLAAEEWDDVFFLVQELPVPDVFTVLLERAFDKMLRAGRLVTLAEWLDAASRLRLVTPVVDLGRAELALRQGLGARAEALAVQVARQGGTSASLRSRALCVAGQAAHFNNRDEDGFSYFESAEGLAEDQQTRREAIWGQLMTGRALGRAEELQALLARLLEEEPETADEIIRAATAKMSVASCIGGLAAALDTALTASGALADAVDPVIRTSFLNGLSRMLSLAARYSEAARLADELLEDAKRARLAVILPHAYVAKAAAEIGLRRFGDAESNLTTAARLARDIGDAHNLADVQTMRCKLAISTRDFDRALAATNEADWTNPPTAEMLGERTAARALAFACAKRPAPAAAAAREALALSTIPEVSALTISADAISALADDDETAASVVTNAVDSLFDLSVVDPLVIACRACPELLETAVAVMNDDPRLLTLAAHGRTQIRRATAGPSLASPTVPLTAREAEVLDLLSLGYSNRQIADALYIAEVTAKVHVRRILRKLGVRSRTEAALTTLRHRSP